MSKQGQHHESQVDPSHPRGHEKSRGNNNPSKSVTITTGTYKKGGSEPNEKPAQHAKNDWSNEMRDEPHDGPQRRARESDIGSGRSGSESNAS